jgi:hypothetical protein
MPSSGYGATNILVADTDEENCRIARLVAARAKVAMDGGLFVEWLESFLAAWEQTGDPLVASWAGLVEWDL